MLQGICGAGNDRVGFVQRYGASNMKLSIKERLEYLRKAFLLLGTMLAYGLMDGTRRLILPKSYARVNTPIDDYFSGGFSVPILDFNRAEYDKVVIPKILKSYLGDRVTEDLILNRWSCRCPENNLRLRADAICKFAKNINYS
jgi:hypothetical protein